MQLQYEIRTDVKADVHWNWINPGQQYFHLL